MSGSKFLGETKGDSAEDTPIVSVGLPVFNGEKYLEDALISILKQTYIDFELIISDNCSTDHTQNICQKYAALDRRIRYYRNDRNLGAPMNYNHAVKLSRGKYFKWASHDDLLAPEYLLKCVSILDKDSTIVLCHSKTARINEKGALAGNYDHKMRIDSQKMTERFRDLISIKTNPCWPIFGVMRKNILERTPLHGNYPGADGNLLAEIALYGRIFEIPEYLFFRRDHPQAYTRKYCEDHNYKSIDHYRAQMAWWASDSLIDITFLRNFNEFFKSVRRAPLKWSDRLLCYEQISDWFIREGWRLMAADLEKYFLCRSHFGRKLASTVQTILRHTVIPLIEKET
jgi:glycosyltransferase involved in cell wall biosynthesis